LRAATRAGQNAIATQMKTTTKKAIHHPFGATSIAYVRFLAAAPQRSE
jgi:hypothetical protein